MTRVILRKIRRNDPVPAYLDSLSGLIRCTAVRLDPDGRNVIVRFRGKRNADMGFKGEQPWPRNRIVPRTAVHCRTIGAYAWGDYFDEPQGSN
jgi:hypothetical protein